MRLLALAVAGMSISICGVVLQSLLRNKFASPTTVGTMHGASLGIVFATAFFANIFLQISFSLIFALVSTFAFIKIIKYANFKSEFFLPLLGFVYIGVLSSFGIFYGILNYEWVFVCLPFIAMAYLYERKFAMVGMGENFANLIGIKHRLVTNIAIIVVSIITTAVVLTIGIIPLVGIVIPNIVRLIFGENTKRNFIYVATLGAVFVVVSDVFSVSVTVLGGGVLLVLLFVRRKFYG